MHRPSAGWRGPWMIIGFNVAVCAGSIAAAQAEVAPPAAMCHPSDSDESTWWARSNTKPRRRAFILRYDEHGECGSGAVRRTFDARQAGLRYCFERHQPPGVDFRHYYDLSWAVLGDGTVRVETEAGTLGEPSKPLGCMRRQLARWRFNSAPEVAAIARKSDSRHGDLRAPGLPLDGAAQAGSETPVSGSTHDRSEAPVCEVRMTLAIQVIPPSGDCERHRERDSWRWRDSNASAEDPPRPWPPLLNLPLGPDGRRVLPAFSDVRGWHTRGRRHSPVAAEPKPHWPACFPTPRTLANAVVDAIHRSDLDAFDALFADPHELADATETPYALRPGRAASEARVLETVVEPYCAETSRGHQLRQLRANLRQLGEARPEVLALRVLRGGHRLYPLDDPPPISGAPVQDLEATLDLNGAPLTLVMEDVSLVDRGYVLAGLLRLRTDAHWAPE